VLDYDDGGEPQYQEHDTFLEMASLIVSEQRASKNDLKANFIRHKEKQGFVIEYIGKDEDAFAEGRGVLAKGKRMDDENYAKAILSAKSLTPAQYSELREAVQAGERPSDTQQFSYERTNLERFYRKPVSKDLIRLDNRGQFRRRVKLFESVFEDPELTRLNFQSEGRSRFVTTTVSKATTILMLLQITPLITGDKFNSEAVIQHSDLTKFAEALVVRWSRLSEQVFRFDKWSLCRG
jgi:cytochrome c-type biogenesis protein CcmE